MTCKSPFKERLQALLNECSMDNGSNTPDFILAAYLVDCLEAFEEAAKTRDDWHGFYTGSKR